jgi:hypothetical protein
LLLTFVFLSPNVFICIKAHIYIYIYTYIYMYVYIYIYMYVYIYIYNWKFSAKLFSRKVELIYISTSRVSESFSHPGQHKRLVGFFLFVFWLSYLNTF